MFVHTFASRRKDLRSTLLQRELSGNCPRRCECRCRSQPANDIVWIALQTGGAPVKCRSMCGVCGIKVTQYLNRSDSARHNFPSYKVRCLLTRRENQSPGAMGKKKFFALSSCSPSLVS